MSHGFTGIILGDCIDVMKRMPAESVDALVTDPPYGWRITGKAWDVFDIKKRTTEEFERPPRKDGKSRGQGDPALCAGLYDQSRNSNLAFQEWTTEWAREALRVLKPGAHALIFCGPRTYHRMACGVEDAGFEVRDQMQWLFGTGLPKSLSLKNIGMPERGTALKPANEPILLARKPLSEKTMAANVLKWGCGGLNIDGSRIGLGSQSGRFPSNLLLSHNPDCVEVGVKHFKVRPQGKFPGGKTFSGQVYMRKERTPSANPDGTETVAAWNCHPKCSVAMLDAQSGVLKNGGQNASRFFYCAKSSKSERGPGCTHPTVKPLKLMRYLVRLITPPQAVVLDPFLGSGTTALAALAEGFHFIGIEREAEYVEIALARLKAAPDVKVTLTRQGQATPSVAQG